MKTLDQQTPTIKEVDKNNVKKQKAEYAQQLEKMKIEFGYFLKLAEKSSWTNRGRLGLKARKQSLRLRELLKEFRNYSINNEKIVTEEDRRRNCDL